MDCDMYDITSAWYLITENLKEKPNKESLSEVNKLLQKEEFRKAMLTDICNMKKLILQILIPFLYTSKTKYLPEERLEVREELSIMGKETCQLFYALYNILEDNDKVAQTELLMNIMELTASCDHKTVVALWKDILQHPTTGSINILPMLGRTIATLYIKRIKEVNYFKVCKFLCIGFLKFAGTVQQSNKELHLQNKINQSCTDLLTSVYRSANTQLPENVTEFFTVFMKSLHKLVKYSYKDSTLRLKGLDVGVLIHLLDNLEPDKDILSDVFNCLRHCCGDIAKGLVLTDKMDTPLINYVIYKLCGFVTTCSPNDLAVVEHVLLQNALCHFMICSLVATDVSIFLARMAPPDLVKKHVIFYLNVLSVVRGYQASSVTLLLNRLLPLVEPEQLVSIASEYIRNEHCYSLTVFNGVSSLTSNVQSVCNDCTLKWNKNTLKSDAYSQTLTNTNSLDSADLSELSLLLVRQCSSFQNDTILDTCYSLIISYLKGLKNSWKTLRCEDKMVVLKELVKLAKLEDPLLSGLVLGIVKCCSKEHYKDPSYSSTIAALIISVYHQDKTQWFCVVVIAHLAQVTPHKEILIGIAKDPAIKQCISKYLAPGWVPSVCLDVLEYVTGEQDVERASQLPSRLRTKSLMMHLKTVGRLPKYSHYELKELISAAVR